VSGNGTQEQLGSGNGTQEQGLGMRAVVYKLSDAEVDVTVYSRI